MPMPLVEPQPERRTPRQTTPRNWGHNGLHLIVYNNKGSVVARGWGESCWCPCQRCWDRSSQRCICQICPCVQERAQTVSALYGPQTPPTLPEPAAGRRRRTPSSASGPPPRPKH